METWMEVPPWQELLSSKSFSVKQFFLSPSQGCCTVFFDLPVWGTANLVCFGSGFSAACLSASTGCLFGSCRAVVRWAAALRCLRWTLSSVASSEDLYWRGVCWWPHGISHLPFIGWSRYADNLIHTKEHRLKVYSPSVGVLYIKRENKDPWTVLL